MKVIRTVSELRAWRDGVAKQTPHARVALVPTMGYLHDGHLDLVAQAKRCVADVDGSIVAMSIFVNPTQFGPNEDFDQYPRDEAGDLEKARSAGVDVVFCPTSPSEMYPIAEPSVWVDIEGLDQHLCGAGRPGHFRGVCTIVTKLWQLFAPDVGVFGQKDYQQLAILRRVHTELFLSGEILGHPIVREADGLALSSRNARLSPQAREDALEISRFIATVQRRFTAGVRDKATLLAGYRDAMVRGEVEYCELVDAADLQPRDRLEQTGLLAIAARYGGVRLIDNCELITPEP